jgi:hypothetical protein
MNSPIHSEEVPFPQAFTGRESCPLPKPLWYGRFLAKSDRPSDRAVGMRPPDEVLYSLSPMCT